MGDGGDTWKILDGAITPAEAVQKFQERGINLSERTLREFARRVGACRIIGKAMFLMPSDVDAILEASRPKPPTPHTANPLAGAVRAGRFRTPEQDYEDLLAIRAASKALKTAPSAAKGKAAKPQHPAEKK